MDLKIKRNEGCDYFANVWEVQDNGHSEIVLKFHNHECVRIPKDDIDSIEILQ